MELDLKNIGACVGSSVHGLMSWRGESITYWGLFDLDPKSVPLRKLREHLIKAIDIKSNKPIGAIRVNSFVTNLNK